MFTTLRLYIYAGVAAAFLAANSLSYFKGRSDSKAAIMAKLQADRVRILKDGKEITEDVLKLDTDGLCDVLGGC